MSRPLTLPEVKMYANRLPHSEGCTGKRLRIPMMAQVDAVYNRFAKPYERGLSYIEFRTRPVHVDGAPAVGWFYHDILVKVDV